MVQLSPVRSGVGSGEAARKVASFLYQDNTCEFCAEGLQTSCPHGGRYGFNGVGGGQAEAIRAAGARHLVKLPVSEDSAPLPGLLTLADVLCTGYHCAVKAGVGPRTTVTVIGDGAVGLSAVIAARMLGAEQIILMGGNKDRTGLGRDFGAAEIIAERGEEGVERVRQLTGSQGTWRRHSRTRLHGSTAARRGWTAPSSPDESSTAPSASTTHPTATVPWATGKRSRSSSSPDASRDGTSGP